MEIINGVETVAGATSVGADIDDATIDNSVIGGTTAAAGTFTTLSADSIADLDSIALYDSNDSHSLTITWDENDTSARTLKLKVSTGSRVLTMTGDATIADWFDQAVKAASSPAFAGVTLNNTGLHLLDSDASHDLIIKPGSNLSADKTLTLTTGDNDRTLTLSGNPTIADWFDQSVKQADSPTFATVTLTNDLGVGDGGTGASTFTDHGVIVGSGSGALSVTATGSSSEVLTSNGSGADPTFQAAAGGGNSWTVATKTTDYTVTTDDFDKTIRMNSASATIATLPSVTGTEDGKVVNIVKQGAGRVTIATSDSDIIDSGSAGGTLVNDQAGEVYANVTLMYLDATVTWVIVGARGTWSTS